MKFERKVVCENPEEHGQVRTKTVELTEEQAQEFIEDWIQGDVRSTSIRGNWEEIAAYANTPE